MTINNIFVDIPENKNVVTFDGRNYVTSFDETFTLVANRNNRRIILDKLEGTIFLEEKFNNQNSIKHLLKHIKFPDYQKNNNLKSNEIESTKRLLTFVFQFFT